MKNEYPIPNIQPVESPSALSSGPIGLRVVRRLFLFLFSRFDTRRAAFLRGHKSVSSSFPIQHSMLGVRCSMFIFSVNLPQPIRCKNNLALMGCVGPLQKPWLNRVPFREIQQGKSSECNTPPQAAGYCKDIINLGRFFRALHPAVSSASPAGHAW